MAEADQQPVAPSIDDCVRAVTAFGSFEDLKDTQPTYAPSFYPGRHSTREEVIAMERVCSAFNAWAKRAGRTRLSEVFRFQVAGEQRKGPFA